MYNIIVIIQIIVKEKERKNKAGFLHQRNTYKLPFHVDTDGVGQQIST